MIATDVIPSQVPSGNRHVYQRLKLALSLGLRRQVFIAVCDDLTLRNQLARRLQATLADPDGQTQFAYQLEEASPGNGYPRLVSLLLNLSDPNPIAQMTQWLTQHPPPTGVESQDHLKRRSLVPAFQILGLERLTGQPVAVQGLFLNHLHRISQRLSALDTSLVLWVPRPWLRAIQKSAPGFWRCRTGVFEFTGEPRPVSAGSKRRAANRQPSRVEYLRELEDSSEVVQAQLPLQSQANQEIAQLVGETTAATATDGDESLEVKVSAQLDAALHDFEPRQALQQIKQLQQQQASAAMLAAAYQRLGNLYRDRIEQGESTPENLTAAIQAYEQALAYLEQSSPQLLDILNDLGTLYWMLSRCQPSPDQALPYLAHGIEIYQLALNQTVPDAQPQSYARIQNNLGAAYGDLARYQNPAESWQQAVLAYTEAIRYRPAEVEPLKYAATQNNLGTAYWHLSQYEQSVPHLKLAIAAYQEALYHYNPAQEPLNYAMIQNNIGTAYWNLAQYEQFQVDYLQQAIDAYSDALKYRTKEIHPAACAATQNNLGTAYWHLANQPQTPHEARQKYLQLCITTYESTLAVAQSLAGKPISFDIFATHNNLGLAYYQMATDHYFTFEKATSTHLEAALHHHLQALQGWQQQPDYYQTAMSFLVKTIRAFYTELGLQGQNLALSKVPGNLLPEILPRLG